MRLLRDNRWPLFVAILSCCSVVYASAIGVDPLSVFVISMPLGLLWAIVWISWEGRAAHPKRTGRLIFVVTFLIGGTSVFTLWPLRLTFWAVKGQLNELADRLERGESIDGPVRVGMLRFQKVEMRYGSYPALELNPDPTGPTSLVRRREPLGNSFVEFKLDHEWWIHMED